MTANRLITHMKSMIADIMLTGLFVLPVFLTQSTRMPPLFYYYNIFMVNTPYSQ